MANPALHSGGGIDATLLDVGICSRGVLARAVAVGSDHDRCHSRRGHRRVRAVLPGVTVTLKGPATAGAPTTTTNAEGIYRFPNLAPGVYQITVELTGFTSSTQTGIQVALGGTSEVGVQLKISAQQESVTVIAQSPVVDATTTQVATNYSREWVANAPVRRFTSST
jgi:Ca-activated chloride channel family protein